MLSLPFDRSIIQLKPSQAQGWFSERQDAEVLLLSNLPPEAFPPCTWPAAFWDAELQRWRFIAKDSPYPVADTCRSVSGFETQNLCQNRGVSYLLFFLESNNLFKRVSLHFWNSRSSKFINIKSCFLKHAFDYCLHGRTPARSRMSRFIFPLCQFCILLPSGENWSL